MVIVLSDILARIQPCFLEWGQWTVVNQPKKNTISHCNNRISYRTRSNSAWGADGEREGERNRRWSFLLKKKSEQAGTRRQIQNFRREGRNGDLPLMRQNLQIHSYFFQLFSKYQKNGHTHSISLATTS